MGYPTLYLIGAQPPSEDKTGEPPDPQFLSVSTSFDGATWGTNIDNVGGYKTGGGTEYSTAVSDTSFEVRVLASVLPGFEPEDPRFGLSWERSADDSRGIEDHCPSPTAR